MKKKIKFLDPSIKRKNDLTNKNFQLIKGTNIPLPSEVEISESGICNRKCSFCPRSDPNYPDIKEFIKDQLIKSKISIIDLGPFFKKAVDYPDYAKKVSLRISGKKSEIGIIFFNM